LKEVLRQRLHDAPKWCAQATLLQRNKSPHAAGF
jgi:hypothetical protein